MLRGTTASISARREAAPIADSMRASSAASGPMWRDTNSSACSSSASGVAVDMSMVSSFSVADGVRSMDREWGASGAVYMGGGGEGWRRRETLRGP